MFLEHLSLSVLLFKNGFATFHSWELMLKVYRLLVVCGECNSSHGSGGVAKLQISRLLSVLNRFFYHDKGKGERQNITPTSFFSFLQGLHVRYVTFLPVYFTVSSVAAFSLSGMLSEQVHESLD